MRLEENRKNLLNSFTLIDFLFIGYMLLLSLIILFFHNGVDKWLGYIGIHFILILVIILLIYFANRTESKILKFLRWWYPVLLFTFNYKEINAFTHILVNEWKDVSILNFEKIIFGGHPTLWLERFATPMLTEVMKLDYFSYYLMMPVGAAVLYFSGKKKAYIRYISTICFAFYISYIGFIVYPVRGPRYTLYDKYTKDYSVNIKEFYGPFVEDDVASKNTMALKGYAITNLQDYIMRYGSLHGGCMPSSHIAVAFVCMIMMWFYKRKMFYVYLPLVSVLCIAVVYNRYHYISDVFAGILVAVMAVVVTPYLQTWWEKLSKKTY